MPCITENRGRKPVLRKLIRQGEDSLQCVCVCVRERNLSEVFFLNVHFVFICGCPLFKTVVRCAAVEVNSDVNQTCKPSEMFNTSQASGASVFAGLCDSTA